jgi:protein phosphatase
VYAHCWPFTGLSGLRLAPFQVLAGEGEALHPRDHLWHLSVAGRLATADAELFIATRSTVVDLSRTDDRAAGWWERLTADRGEGMVVKPLGELPTGRKVQPGLKCRGQEYLRIIYGTDYMEHLDRLRGRSLGRKRSLAMSEHALGVEALGWLIAGEPLWRVHQAVFAVLALGSEPVDPRL